MPGSYKSKSFILMLINYIGIATAFADHDFYIQKLDGFSKSQDPELINGTVANEVFSYDIGNSFTHLINATTFFKYYATIDLFRFPNGIFSDESDRLLVKTQEVLLKSDLAHIVNDDLQRFTDSDMNLTGELTISEFNTFDGYNVLYWTGNEVTQTGTPRKLYSFHVQGPKLFESTSFTQESYTTWIHAHFYFESENGTLTLQEARSIVESVKFLESTNLPFEPEEREGTAASFPLYSKDPQWYESTWFGNYYDTTTGWIYHEFLDWIYTEGSKGNGIWFWHENLGWFWTKDGIYPYIYSQLVENWFYLGLNSTKPKKYYSFANLTWLDLSSVNLEVQLDALINQNSGNSSPNDIKREAIKIVAESKLSEEEKSRKISSIILYGL